MQMAGVMKLFYFIVLVNIFFWLHVQNGFCSAPAWSPVLPLDFSRISI